MSDLPFTLPESLNSYLEQFPEQPERSIERLQAFLKKRGQDAVGHMLLAWLYFLNGDKERAVSTALLAKRYAPGSPLLEYFHFYLLHPDRFQARIPDKTVLQQSTTKSQREISADLERLITRLSETRGSTIEEPDESPLTEEEDLSKKTSRIQDIATETLASIYAKQGKLNDAIRVYEQLKIQRPKKASEYEKEIGELREQLKEGE